MRTRIACVCRGDGKAYMEMRVSGLASPESRLGLTGATPEGRAVPTQLYVLDEDGRTRRVVLVFPIASRAIRLTLNELAPGGTGRAGAAPGAAAASAAAVSAATAAAAAAPAAAAAAPTSTSAITVRPAQLKWTSRLNYRLKKEACMAIRDIDQGGYLTHPTIRFDRCIPSDTANILRLSLFLPQAEERPWSLTMLDNAFEAVPIDPILMSSETIPKSPRSPADLRCVGLSVRIPQRIASYTFLLESPDAAFKPSFGALDAETYGNLLAAYHQLTLDASQDPAYPQWFEKHRTPEQAKKRQRATQLPYAPLISIVVPLYKTPLPYFHDMVESVTAQTYQGFELILVNGDPENTALGKAVAECNAADTRIREVRLAANEGISKNTFAGIQEARGEYVAFLDHDDTLEPDALFEYAFALNEDPALDLLYCDEDKLFPNGRYGNPYFKPDYSLFMLRENNYICHFLMVRKGILDKLSINDARFDGAQDHHLILQAVEQGAQVHHVPKVLYHWRVSASSTAAATSSSKPYADTAGIHAIEGHLARQSIEASVTPTRLEHRFRVSYHVMGEPLVSIIIPNKDNAAVLDTCISSILDKSSYQNFEIIIIENNSSAEETFAYYESLTERDTRIRLITWEHEFNFSKLMNFGAGQARGDYLLLLNNDTEVISPDWLETMLGICQQPEVGVVGAKLYYPDGTIQHAGVYVEDKNADHINADLDKSNLGYFATTLITRELSAVTAACLMTKRAVFQNVDGFDERFVVNFNDVDYCLKVRDRGLSVIFSPAVELFHYESLSRGSTSTTEKIMLMHREISLLYHKWPRYKTNGDPFGNPNLHSADCFVGRYKYYPLDTREFVR
ncbi:MAG: glycosyltransferase family 2 protein [Eggerthellaceae bacterium]|nr:glycosyltransferase family 2 protein [Eggerthellaceae bacterium]